VLFTPAGRIIHYGAQTTRKERGRFALQLAGAVLINVRKHYSWLTFLVCRLLTACYFLVRIPYWLMKAAAAGEGRWPALRSAKTYCVGCFYALFDWPRLVMNRDQVVQTFRQA
jgi:GT2 family glycosyltransferase